MLPLIRYNQVTEGLLPADQIHQRVRTLCEEVGVAFKAGASAPELLSLLKKVQGGLTMTQRGRCTFKYDHTRARP